MNKLYIFLFLAAIFCCQQNIESFVSCSTLRCENNKYSFTSVKNVLRNKINTQGHIANIKNHIANFKQQWL